VSVPTPETNIPPYGNFGISQDDKTMAMLAYLLGIFTGFLGPLLLWVIKKDQSKFVGYHALQALLLHAVVSIGYLVSSFPMVVLIGFVTFPVFGLLGLIFSIIAGLAANRGEWYEIPLIGPIARQQTGI